MGRTLNTRLSQTVRGHIIQRLRHIAAEHGIAVVTVPQGAPRRTAPAASRRCGTANPPTGRLFAAGSGRGAPGAAGRATVTTAPGSGSPPAASPTRPRPRPTATTASWPCAPSMTSSKPGLSLPLTLPGGTAPRVDRLPGGAPHAARPGDARHPPRRDHQATAASVRRDARHRPGLRCLAQPAGTSARARPAQLRPGAPTGHAGRHSAPGSTSAPTPPRPDGNQTPSTIPLTGDN